MENEIVLELCRVTKRYGKREAVIRDLSLQIPAGRIVGLLGPNGCGKTTVLKLTAGLLCPTEGEILVCGQPRSEKSNALISYLPDRMAFSQNWTARQMMAYYGDFFPDFSAEQAKKMLEDLQIPTDQPARLLSKGTRDKLQLVLTMARQARLYLLDEPMAAIDPASREYILRTIITNYNPEAAVVITTHLIADVENALDDYIFLGFGGKILGQGNVEDVRSREEKSLDAIFREVFKC